MTRRYMGVLMGVVLFFSSLANANERLYRDEETGREILFLKNKMSWYEAERTCRERGYAMFDLRYLEEKERGRFLNSDFLNGLNWETLYPGTSRETKMTSLWQGSQGATIAVSASFGSTLLLMQKRRDKLTLATESQSSEEYLANAACLAVDGFWYRCTSELKCTYTDASSTWSIRYLFADFGATKTETLKRIVETTEHPEWSVSSGKCAINPESMHCSRYLP